MRPPNLMLNALLTNETKLQLEAVRLREAAEEVARKRLVLENARQEALEVERLAEFTRARDEARAFMKRNWKVCEVMRSR